MRATSRAAVYLAATLTAFALSSSNGIASRDPVSISALAPADEYFGRQKLSPLGIRHEIYTLKDDLHHARQQPGSIQNKANLVEDAVDDWVARFPQDPWIPSAAWQLATLFEELPGIDAHEHAIVVLELVKDKFPQTTFAANAQRDLSRGVGIRPWPHWALASAPTATPPAQPSATATGTATATSSPSPAATVVASDPQSLVRAILDANATPDPQRSSYVGQLDDRFWSLSHGGTDAAYVRAAWELAAQYERLPGEDSRTQAIRLLALLVDRYPSQIFGKWALRDLERGIGQRS